MKKDLGGVYLSGIGANIPNILTAIRLLLVPVFGVLVYGNHYMTAAIVFFIASFTDAADGYIARKYNSISEFGKFFDPLADKLLSLTAVFMLAFRGRICWIIPAVILLKDLLIGIGGLLLYRKKHVVKKSKWYGKVATLMFFVSILLCMFDKTLKIGTIFLWITVIFSIFAFAMYGVLYSNIKHNKER